ncbi:MAG: MFS transporter [Chloroflexi bacterium]|nr:MFS transporter [Chloroflexota bacterium]
MSIEVLPRRRPVPALAEDAAAHEQPQGTVSFREVLANGPFLRLWIAQALSQTAQNAIFYALMVLVERVTHSSLNMSLLILSIILPPILFGVLAGVLVDHWNKKAILIAANLLRGLVALAYLLFHFNFGLIYAVNFVFATVGQFFSPAELAATPALVKRRELLAANSLLNLTFTGAQMVGLVVLGPILVKLMSVDALFVAIALIFFICTALLCFLPGMEAKLPRRQQGASPFSALRGELGQGWGLLKRNRGLSLSIFYLTFAGAFLIIMGMLIPGYVARVLGVPPEDAVFIFAPAGIGAILGIGILSRLIPQWSEAKLVHLGLALLTFSLLALGLIGLIKVSFGNPLVGLAIPGPSLPDLVRVYVDPNVTQLWGTPSRLPSITDAVMLVALALGAAFAMINIPAQTAVQESVPEEMRGRIFAVQLVAVSIASVLPLLFLGSLADLIDINYVILLLALVVAGITYLSQGRRPSRAGGKAVATASPAAASGGEDALARRGRAAP